MYTYVVLLHGMDTNFLPAFLVGPSRCIKSIYLNRSFIYTHISFDYIHGFELLFFLYLFLAQDSVRRAYMRMRVWGLVNISLIQFFFFQTKTFYYFDYYVCAAHFHLHPHRPILTQIFLFFFFHRLFRFGRVYLTVYFIYAPPSTEIGIGNLWFQLLLKPKFSGIEKIKTIGSTYMTASGLRPGKEEGATVSKFICFYRK